MLAPLYCTGTLSLSRNFLYFKTETLSYTHTHTWQLVLLLVKKQNPIPFAALAVVGTHKSSLTTTPYIFGGAQMGVVWISADQFSQLQTELE